MERWGAGLLLSVLVTGASALGWLEGLQARTLDLVQPPGGRPTPADVVVVAIDDAAFEALGARQPIPRDYLAPVVGGARLARAAGVGLDVTLAVATTAEADAAPVRALTDPVGVPGRPAVGAENPPATSGPFAAPSVRSAVPRGSDRGPVDPDGVVRRMTPLWRRLNGSRAPAFSLALLAALSPAEPTRAPAAAGRRPGPETDLAAYPRWEDGRWVPGRGPSTPLRSGDLWRIPFLGPAQSVWWIPADRVATRGGDDSQVAEE